jgi:drug/metabolite transporter (DMT)-like permease
MLATMLCFIALDAIMKLGLAHASVVQVTWGRFFFATLFSIAACAHDLPRLIRSAAPVVQVMRSCFLMVTTGLFATGIATVPLATATTIMFLSPIFVTTLSIPLLNEHVGIRRWFGVLAGLIGAVIVVAPWRGGVSEINTGTFFLVAAALTNGLYQITTRQSRNDDPMTSLLYTALAGAIITSAILPLHWTPPSRLGWTLLIASGALGLLGHLCLIKALHAAPASVVAPFSYSSLLWATLFGVILWNDWPAVNTWIGAAIIIASGLYIFYREQKLKGL